MFTLALGDLDNARVPMETTLDSVGSWNYVSVTTEWQHVKHPAERADAGRQGRPARHL